MQTTTTGTDPEALLAVLERLQQISRWTQAIQLGTAAVGLIAVLGLLDIGAYGAAGTVAVLTPLVWFVGYLVELQVTSLVWRAPTQ